MKINENKPMTSGELNIEEKEFYPKEMEFCEEVHYVSMTLKNLTSTSCLEKGVDYQEILEKLIELTDYAYDMRESKKNLTIS